MLPKNAYTGIVACGGQSSRMGQDKSRLRYHALPQHDHVFRMLQDFCSETYISCNPEQAPEIDSDYPRIVDHPAYTGLGPLTALLSAIHACPGKNIIMLACDYPYLTRDEIGTFVSFARRSNPQPAAFYDRQAQAYVPVLGCYPHETHSCLLDPKSDPGFSLQRFLKQEHAARFIPANPGALIGVDDPEMMLKTKQKIQERTYGKQPSF